VFVTDDVYDSKTCISRRTVAEAEEPKSKIRNIPYELLAQQSQRPTNAIVVKLPQQFILPKKSGHGIMHICPLFLPGIYILF
jgi:hypothetical protein